MLVHSLEQVFSFLAKSEIRLLLHIALHPGVTECVTTNRFGASPPAAVAQGTAEPLPVPAAADVWIARARALHGKGRLREALLALDAIGADDPAYVQAEALRAMIQRQLLAASRSTDGRLMTSPSSAQPASPAHRQ